MTHYPGLVDYGSKGLTGSTGPGTGTWRLSLYGVGEAYAYVPAADGFLTAMNATAPPVRSVIGWPSSTPAATTA